MSTRQLIFFVIFLFIILLIRFISYNPVSYKIGNQILLERTLTTQPKTKNNTQQFWVDNILIITTRFPEYNYGDRLHISGTLQERVTNNNRTILIAYFPKLEAIKKERNLLLAVSDFIRQNVTHLFQSSLPTKEGGLLAGIVLGSKENMDSDFSNNLKKTGTLHVVAASGMNVSMVGGSLLAFLTLFLRRQVALVLTLLGIFFYASLASFEPSIVRATLMGGLAFAAQTIGRQNLGLFALILSAFAMLLFDPKLLWDIGFQLSFLATLGILFIKPVFDTINFGPIEKFKKWKLSFLIESFSTTLSAQVATLPILLANFGSFFLFSIVANMLVLWTVPIIMVIGSVAAILGFITKPLASVALFLSLPYLLFFEAVVGFFGRFPGQFNFENFPTVVGAGYYLILLSIILIKNI